MKCSLIALAFSVSVAPTAPASAGTEGNAPVGYYSPDVSRVVANQPTFPSDAHRENETGISNPQPALLPAILTQLRGVNLDGLARQNGRFVFSVDVATEIGSSGYFPGDVIRCDDGSCANRTLLLDALTDVPRHINVDGVGFDRTTGDLLYSIEADASYEGSRFLSTDIIRFDGTNHSLMFDGLRLPSGANLDGLDGTADGFLISTDIAGQVLNTPTSSLIFRNHDIVAFSPATQVFSFTAFSPSGNWDGANLDALHGGTVADSDRIFASGFDSP